jgi:pimeloyl-ACP methyl ester carboxylesterase
VTLAAHDWGGMVAWVAARELEARGELARLVIVNIPHPARFFANLGVAQALRSLYIVCFQVPWLPEWLLSRDDGRPIEGMFLGSHLGVARRTGPTALTRADVAVFKHHLAQPGRLTAALNWYRQIFDGSLDDMRAAPTPDAPLAAPTLVLWGTHDEALGEELLRGTDRVCADLRVHRLEGCSHWAQQDHVAECVDAVARFLGVTAAPLGAAPP